MSATEVGDDDGSVPLLGEAAESMAFAVEDADAR